MQRFISCGMLSGDLCHQSSNPLQLDHWLILEASFAVEISPVPLASSVSPADIPDGYRQPPVPQLMALSESTVVTLVIPAGMSEEEHCLLTTGSLGVMGKVLLAPADMCELSLAFPHSCKACQK